MDSKSQKHENVKIYIYTNHSPYLLAVLDSGRRKIERHPMQLCLAVGKIKDAGSGSDRQKCCRRRQKDDR